MFSVKRLFAREVAWLPSNAVLDATCHELEFGLCVCERKKCAEEDGGTILYAASHVNNGISNIYHNITWGWKTTTCLIFPPTLAGQREVRVNA